MYDIHCFSLIGHSRALLGEHDNQCCTCIYASTRTDRLMLYYLIIRNIYHDLLANS